MTPEEKADLVKRYDAQTQTIMKLTREVVDLKDRVSNDNQKLWAVAFLALCVGLAVGRHWF